MLREKALSLQGYATLFGESTDLSGKVRESIDKLYPLRWLRV